MKHCLPYVYLLVITCTGIIQLSAQDKKNQTLLWRIQKADHKPSFLFGTMHISDKKAFNFRDSLYLYLEQAEAFALEFNPDSANQIITAYLKGELSSVGDNDLSENIVATNADSLNKIFSKKGAKAGKVRENKPGVIDLFANRLNNNHKKQAEAMTTFMDAFLYDMAKNHGKKIFGLEELEGKGEVIKAIAGGLKEKQPDSLPDNWNISGEESPVHYYYLNEDIDSIDHFFNEYFTEKSLDIFLYDRNELMANRMDSIMQGQSLFAAMGAGHLAGKRGVIALLQKKGYSVEPVFSSHRISAGEYIYKKSENNWLQEKHDEYGLQYRLPGISTKQDGANGRKIVYHYDIGGGIIFMTIYGKLSAKDQRKNINEIVTTHLDEMMRLAGGKVLSRKSLVVDNMKAVEAICLYNDNTYYRYREMIKDNIYYILSVGSGKRDNLSSPKAEEYFSSFQTIPIPPTNWSHFSAPSDGFSILFPGKPLVEEVPLDRESNGTLSLNSYSYFDANSGVGYLATSGKALAGNQYLEGDGFFQSYIDHIKLSSIGEPVVTDTLMYGYPCKIFNAATANSLLRGIIVKRDNTSHYVVAEYENNGKAAAEVDKFLGSFKLTAFEKPAWSLQTSPANDFSAWLPGPVKEIIEDSTAYDFVPGELQFVGHDPFAALSYSVEVYPINKYYWAAHIDSVYNHWQNKVMNTWSDTVLGLTQVKNGGLEGRELLLMNKTNKNKRIIRLLLNGTRMYVLVNKLPLVFFDEANSNRFFQEFRLSKEEKVTGIFENTPDSLFADLLSRDSATFQQAYNALNEVQFSKKEIRLLLEKATTPYSKYVNNYQSVNYKLISIAEKLLNEGMDISDRRQVTALIRRIYSMDNMVVDSLRFSLLGIIAAGKTTEDYLLVKELLAAKRHAADFTYGLFSKFYDSLDLTRSLYPGLLNHIDDTTMGLPVATLTKTMIDSSRLSIEMLLPIKAGVIKLAKKQLKVMNREDFDQVYELPDLIGLLSYFRQNDTDDIIAGFLKSKNGWVKKAAALALVKNNKPVPASVWLAIAKDPEYRVELYTDLKKMQKEKLFPADYRTQVGLAEGYVFNAVYDEEEDATRPELIFIKKMEYEYKGSRKWFYIFRAKYEYETTGDEESDEEMTTSITEESWFTLAGPFDADTSKFSIDEKENISGMWYDDKFDGMKNDYFFRKYIEQRLKWQNDLKK